MPKSQSPEILLLERLERVLQLEGVPASYVQAEILWIRQRREVWERSTWRVGLAGITSAGKSTLANAICGEDILPRDARPTSGVLVSARRGTTRQAVIVRRDGTRETLEGAALCPNVIAEYADEQRNPGNYHEVDEIQLSLPTCLLAEGVEIIDSPGLDAFGLEGHEAITLRQLIPSVDIVLYLTTTKANSDARNLQVLDGIASDSKPVMILQNCMDAVEPEITSGGIIRRSREEVLARLKERICDVAEQATNQPVHEAAILQVSAVWALQGRTGAPTRLHIRDQAEGLRRTRVRQKGKIRAI